MLSFTRSVNAFLDAAEAGRPGIWNIGAGVEASVLDLARIISGGRPFPPAAVRVDAAGRTGAQRPRNRPGSVLPGLEPSTSLADGIAKVYRWVEAGPPDRASC